MKSYKTDLLRNVGLFSHGGAGKTSLAEAFLFDSKATTRLGRVDEGNTVTDFDPDEVKRRISVSTSIAPCEWQEHKINVLDAPGYADFVGEMKAAMRVVDAAVIVLDASAGVEVGTELVWKFAEERKVPRFIAINKMDRENANFETALESARQILGNQVVAIQVPIGNQAGFRGLVDLLDQSAYVYANHGDGKAEKADIPADMASEVERYREQLVERVAESDDNLLVKYLEGETISDEEIRTALRRGVLSGAVTPVLACSALWNMGASQILDAIVAFGPSPLEAAPIEATRPGSGETVSLEASPTGPLAALVFKTLADPFVGKLTYFRVFSGRLAADSQILNATRGREERVGQVYFVRGKEQEATPALEAGDIGAVAKLQETSTGDTLCLPARPLLLSGINFPSPAFTAAIHPKSKTDLDKLSTALARIVEEDPTLAVTREPQTGETLLSGMGESHLQIAAERMQRKFGVGVDITAPQVPYRETVTSQAKAEYKHKKQTGGHGQYGHVHLEIEPLANGGFEFQEKIVGGVVPKQYIPAVEKGVREALHEGLLAGYPVSNVRVTLLDGSYHTVDSSEMAFKIAASQAFKKGALAAGPVILEPVVDMEITVPDSYMGDVIGDLNAKRSRVLGMNPVGDGQTVIQAQAPLAEVQRYATDLRSITQGRGTFSMHFSHYEEVPQHLRAQIIEAAKARKEG